MTATIPTDTELSEQPSVCHPEQPDGIEFDSRDLPTVKRAARRVRAWISEWGDGLINVANLRPLYARDVFALVQATEESERLRAEALTADERRRAANAIQAYIRICGDRIPADHPYHSIAAKLATTEEAHRG